MRTLEEQKKHVSTMLQKWKNATESSGAGSESGYRFLALLSERSKLRQMEEGRMKR